MEFLLFHLYGPMAAWGATAVGEYRPSHAVPSRAAIVGLIAGSLGIRRIEEQKHLQLYEDMEMAVAVLRMGVLLRDYHSIQTPSREKTPFLTRKAELEASTVNTLLSMRDYRTDAYYRVAIWLSQAATIDLETIKKALNRPVFTPYLGRKSCPLSVPMAPEIIESASLAHALRAGTHPLDYLINLPTARRRERDILVYHDEFQDASLAPIKTIQMKDRLLSRVRWQFGDRTVRVSSMEDSNVL